MGILKKWKISSRRKRSGERDDDNHIYCHLNEVQKDNANKKAYRLELQVV